VTNPVCFLGHRAPAEVPLQDRTKHQAASYLLWHRRAPRVFGWELAQAVLAMKRVSFKQKIPK